MQTVVDDLGLTYDVKSGDSLATRLGKGEHELVVEARQEGGLEVLLALVTRLAELEAEVE